MEWYVIAQNKFLPMSNSAVESKIPREKAVYMKEYDDRKFRSALKESNIEYYGACNFFFDIDLLNKYKNDYIATRFNNFRDSYTLLDEDLVYQLCLEAIMAIGRHRMKTLISPESLSYHSKINDCDIDVFSFYDYLREYIGSFFMERYGFS